MRFAVVQRILGMLLMLFSTSMLPPIAFSFGFGESQSTLFERGFMSVFGDGFPSITPDGSQWAFIYGFGVTFAAGFVAWLPVRSDRRDLRLRDGFGIVAGFWVVLGTFGAAPLLFSIQPVDVTDRRGLRSHIGSHDDRRDGPVGPGRPAAVDSVLPPAAAMARRHGHHRARGGRTAHARRRRHAALSRRDPGAGQGHEADAADCRDRPCALVYLCRPDGPPARSLITLPAWMRSTRFVTASARSRSVVSRPTTPVSATSTAWQSISSQSFSC